MKTIRLLALASLLVFASCQTLEDRAKYSFEKGSQKLLLETGNSPSTARFFFKAHVFNGDKLIYSGSIGGLNKSMLQDMLSAMYDERVFPQVGVYGVFLGDPVSKHSQLFPINRIKSLSNSVIPFDGEKFGWDHFIVEVDEQSIIQGMQLVKFLESDYENNLFFKDIRNLIESKYIKTVSFNEQLVKLNRPDAIDPNNDSISIYGSPDFEHFASKATAKIRFECTSTSIPNIELALDRIINDHLYDMNVFKYPYGREYAIDGDPSAKVVLTIRSNQLKKTQTPSYQFNKEDF